MAKKPEDVMKEMLEEVTKLAKEHDLPLIALAGRERTKDRLGLTAIFSGTEEDFVHLFYVLLSENKQSRAIINEAIGQFLNDQRLISIHSKNDKTIN